MICSKCGKKIPKGNIYCGKCGGSADIESIYKAEDLIKSIEPTPAKKEWKVLNDILAFLGFFILIALAVVLFFIRTPLFSPEKTAGKFMDAFIAVDKDVIESSSRIVIDDDYSLELTLDNIADFIDDGGTISYELQDYEPEHVNKDEISSMVYSLGYGLDSKKINKLGSIKATIYLTDSKQNVNDMEVELKLVKYPSKWYVYDFSVTKPWFYYDFSY